MKLVRRADLVPQPWKNGGGITREIAAHPLGAGMGDFAWRISIADVAQDGPFSAFPGIDRTLTVLDGRGLTLDFGGGAIRLQPGAPLSFPGEAPVTARLTDGPITDLNVMTRRGFVGHSLRLVAAGTRAAHGTAALVALGTARMQGLTLDCGDTLLAEGDRLPEISADALAIMFWTTASDATAGFPFGGG